MSLLRSFVFAAALLLAPSAALADKNNFDLSAQLYTKWLYRNNASGGCLSYGNPFYPDDFAGDNGVCSTLDLTANGHVSDWASAMIHLQSIFGATWQDYYENGNIKYPTANTSAQSLGTDHSMILRLAGFNVRLKPPIPTVTAVHFGSSDLGMFNPWTVGKIRYIERDNAKAVLATGRTADANFDYSVGAIALPKLWAGPGWSTGLGEDQFFPANSLVRSPFTQNDWAYALRLVSHSLSAGPVALTGVFSNDYEANIYDPDTKGTLAPAPATCGKDGVAPDPTACADGAVDLVSRYRHMAATGEAKLDLGHGIQLDGTAAVALQRLNSGTPGHPGYVANGVALNGRVFPMAYKDATAPAGVARLSADDLWSTLGLSRGAWEVGVKFEYFNIGSEFNAMLGARRESDVLLTDGIVAPNQLPTLNLANEFVDFDDQWVESIVGWNGGTTLVTAQRGDFSIKAEYTLINYNTNKQGRDVNNVYPTFLFNQGYTDTDIYDYANPKTIDRGRDPRAVYAEDQDRLTQIGVLWLGYQLPVWRGVESTLKLKYVRDIDGRSTTYSPATGSDAEARCMRRLGDRFLMDQARCDDYVGNIFIARPSVGYQFNDELKWNLGVQLDWWLEQNRSGTKESGYNDYETRKVKPFIELAYLFGGVHLHYYLEYLNKTIFRETDPRLHFGIVRSKMTMEVAW